MAVDLKRATDPRWIDVVMADFDAFLQDHASAEKKASGMALAVAAHYPDRPELLSAMTELAVEELTHYRDVVRLMISKGVTPAADRKDPYVNALNREIRRGPENFLVDRLSVGAIVERRGHERFSIVSEALKASEADPALTRFYRRIAASEERHYELFMDLARAAGAQLERIDDLLTIEARIVSSLPLRAALH